jgi:hypothetical protein
VVAVVVVQPLVNLRTQQVQVFWKWQLSLILILKY